jgi:hypothetical protein
MAANCPAAISCLLNGCIFVYQSAYEVLAFINKNEQINSTNLITATQQLRNRDSYHHQHRCRQIINIVNICIESVRLLSKLSPREAQRIMFMLRRQCSTSNQSSMIPLQLQLSMQYDPLAACFLIIQNLDNQSETLQDDLSKSYISTLREYLTQKLDLLLTLWNFLYNELSNLAKPIPIPKLSIILTTYIAVVTTIPMNRFLAEHGYTILHSCFTKLRNETMIQLQEQSMDDKKYNRSKCHAYDLLVIALLSTYSILLADKLFQEADDGSFMTMLLDRRKVPTQSHELLIRISLAIQYTDPLAIYHIIDSTLVLYYPNRSITLQKKDDNHHFLSYLTELCSFTLSKQCIDISSIEDDIYRKYAYSPTTNLTIALQLIEATSAPDSIRMKVVQKTLSYILIDSNCSAMCSQDARIVDFIDHATLLLLNSNQHAKLPLIMPIQMETTVMTIKWGEWEQTLDGSNIRQFLLQLLYCFTFLYYEPKSPFLIDPRTLPLHLVWELCECNNNTSLTLNPHVICKLKHYMNMFYPHARKGYQYRTLKSRNRLLFENHATLLVDTTKKEFSKYLHSIVAQTHIDPNGLLAEQAFIEASRYLSDADLNIVCACELISQKLSPPLYFTYPMLYRDPLILLKCPLNNWNRRGTRRIIITILSSLLEINEQFIYEQAPNDEVFLELLSSRNAIILTCLLRMMTSTSMNLDQGCRQCGITCGLVRKLIANHPGITALMIRQCLTESEMDWMIESVPEIITDIPLLCRILSDRSSLSAAERLAVADCNLRIVIAYGLTNDEVAESVAHASLTQLLSSFFLILGPIGVPVNTLIGEGDGVDSTQVSRKAAFRMLNAMLKIRTFQARFKNNVSMILQKFAGMCKGESIGGALPTAIASRQKALLKDLLDAVARANESMGSISSSQEYSF